MKPAVLLLALLASPLAQGQEPARPAELEPLQAFVGSWTVPGQERSYKETCAWYPGERHIVCNTVLQRQDGSVGHGMSILSFVPGQGYVYTGIGSRGRYQTHARGRFHEGVLEYLDSLPGGETQRIRIGPFDDRQQLPFAVHHSRNGQDWEAVESFRYQRLP